jgi:hypothetical protein
MDMNDINTQCKIRVGEALGLDLLTGAFIFPEMAAIVEIAKGVFRGEWPSVLSEDLPTRRIQIEGLSRKIEAIDGAFSNLMFFEGEDRITIIEFIREYCSEVSLPTNSEELAAVDAGIEDLKVRMQYLIEDLHLMRRRRKPKPETRCHA